MTSLDPLKTVISIGNVDDTSLALPSVNQYGSGQQRVREQVQSIRRTKSRQSSSGSKTGSSSLSPTSPRMIPIAPSYDSVFIETPKSQSSISNGGAFFGNGIARTILPYRETFCLLTQKYVYQPLPYKLSVVHRTNPQGYKHVFHNVIWHRQLHINFEKSSRQLVNNYMGSTVKRNTAASTYQYEKGYAPLGSMAVGRTDTSRSEPDMAWQRTMPKRSAPPQGYIKNRNTYRAERTTSQLITSTASQPQLQRNYTMNGTGQTRTNSQFVCSQAEATKTLSKPPPVTESALKNKGDFGSNDNSGIADITMKEAVDYLLSDNETYQHCGASYIQHNTYIDDKAKEEVLKFNGIQPLVGLLRSSSPQVSQTASAALRNLAFKSNSNKEEIHRCGGVTDAVALLRDSDSMEIQKQLTGLLWNLSSADSVKPDLLKSALPVLMERVILPYTTGPDRTSKISQDPEVFFNATGCLRNLSSTKQSNRQTMRKCRGLVDSLVSYVKDCVDAGKPDDKSVENCVCVLHNLTFQLENEAPALFNRITALAKTVNRTPSQGDTGPIGCFSPQGKASDNMPHFDFPVVEDPQPSGAGQLIHTKTLQNYLSLLATSQREETQEACCGALQNLTAHEGIVSGVMSQNIVQKLNGLQVLTPLLKSEKVNLQKNVVALVGNLTKNPNLHNAIARKALPELLDILTAGTKGGNESDDTLSMACQTSNCLLMKEHGMGKFLIKYDLIKSLKELSQNEYFPKSSKTAALLLYNMWSEKDIQALLKKKGMTKSSFVNDITTAAHNSVQVID